MIKISKTEPYENTLVFKGILILIWGDCREEEFYKYGLESHDKTEFAKPIIISDIEKVEVGDSVKNSYQEIVDYTKEIENIYGKYDSCFKKIIALPENFSPELLKDIANGKIEEGQKIFIECEKTLENDTIDDNTKYIEFSENIIKLNKEGHINIFPCKKETDENEIWNEVFRIAFNPDISFGTKEAMVREKFNPPTKK